MVVAQEYKISKADLPSRAALKTFRRAINVLNRVDSQAHDGEGTNTRWTCLKRPIASTAGFGLKQRQSWKPRLGRLWWEDGLRNDAQSIRSCGILNKHISSDTESDSASESDHDEHDDKLPNYPFRDSMLPQKPADFIGQRVQRCSVDAHGSPVASANATVVAYLNAQVSGFIDPKTHMPAPLWRIRFHDAVLGEEDLQDFELVDAYFAYRGVCSVAAMHRDATGAHWQATGSPLIGRTVRRGIVDQYSRHAGEGKLAGFVDGTIRAWLPPEASSYFGKNDSSPQPLFRVVYHRKEIGVEDLDLDQVHEGIAAYSVPKEADRDDEWLAHGNCYIGQRIRRSVMDTNGLMTAVDGMVRGWLPAELSNFWSDHSRRPAALWRVVYDKADIGQEDLEDFEVEEAVQVYQIEVVRAAAAAAPTPSGAAPTPSGGDDEWLTQGHSFIGQRVRRSILDERKTVSADVDGTVIGWLPADMSNYFKDDDPNQPAALWRVQYDDAAIGQEDLEHSEVLDASAMFRASAEKGAPRGAESLGNKVTASMGEGNMGPETEKDQGGEDEWWTSGSEHLGRRVRRFIFSDQGEVLNTADAIVRGWLPAHASNFLTEPSGEPV